MKICEINYPEKKIGLKRNRGYDTMNLKLKGSDFYDKSIKK